jgi:hypothetical protein
VLWPEPATSFQRFHRPLGPLRPAISQLNRGEGGRCPSTTNNTGLRTHSESTVHSGPPPPLTHSHSLPTPAHCTSYLWALVTFDPPPSLSRPASQTNVVCTRSGIKRTPPIPFFPSSNGLSSKPSTTGKRSFVLLADAAMPSNPSSC